MEKKFFFSIILILFYLSFGFFLSINTGISHDESHEQLNWLNNFEAYKSIFNLGDYNKLLNYNDKYHGIAFQFISQPIQYLIFNLVSSITETTKYVSYLLSKHFAIFIIFSCSAFYFYRICLLINSSKAFSRLSTILYIFYPYLLGHSFINPKDIPFLSFWCISTFYFLKILKKIYLNKIILKNNILKLAFFTSFLISIRILGFLILIEFLIGIIILFNTKKINFIKIIQNNFKNIFYFFFVFAIVLYSLNPIFWNSPNEIVNSIKYMSRYFHNVCTLTLGKCDQSLSLSPNYYFIWFFFKLPIISLIGILIFPLVEKKIMVNNFSLIVFLTLIITAVSIIFLFVFRNIAIYDEIRHIMFILPLILIPTFHNLYTFSKKLFFFVSFLSLFFFISDNFRLYPYQYTWLNEFSRFYDINKNFEVDYWGISNKKLQKHIINMKQTKKISNDICIFGDGYTSAFLEKKGFVCFKSYSEIDAPKARPFVAYQNLRNLKRNSPNNCELMHEEKYSYSFSRQKIIVGKVWYCN